MIFVVVMLFPINIFKKYLYSAWYRRDEGCSSSARPPSSEEPPVEEEEHYGREDAQEVDAGDGEEEGVEAALGATEGPRLNGVL